MWNHTYSPSMSRESFFLPPSSRFSTHTKLNKMIQELVNYILWNIFAWSGSKLFKYIDLYSPEEVSYVSAITFSNNKKYIDEVSKIELEHQEVIKYE